MTQSYSITHNTKSSKNNADTKALPVAVSFSVYFIHPELNTDVNLARTSRVSFRCQGLFTITQSAQRSAKNAALMANANETQVFKCMHKHL